jgi:hypothetical protein
MKEVNGEWAMVNNTCCRIVGNAIKKEKTEKL